MLKVPAECTKIQTFNKTAKTSHSNMVVHKSPSVTDYLLLRRVIAFPSQTYINKAN